MANMQVILLSGIHGVGKVGETVKVKAGFARNYLLPRKLALIATKANNEIVAKQKAELEAKSAADRAAAEKVAAKFEALTLTLSRNASETGQLYGSVKARDLATELAAKGLDVEASQVLLTDAIKMVGDHSIRVALHPEVVIKVPVVVERTTAL
jgi:large subunit ribosomal protein L9